MADSIVLQEPKHIAQRLQIAPDLMDRNNIKAREGEALVCVVFSSVIPVLPQHVGGCDSESGARIVDLTLAPLASVPVVERVG